MTHLFGFAALAIGGYLVVKGMKKKMAEVERRLSEAARGVAETDAAPKLVLDPKTGRYRPSAKDPA